MIRLNIHEAKTHLSRYLARLRPGETIVLCRRNEPIAEIRELRERATEEGGDCLVVPADFERGGQFRDGFGGVGAVLRFPID